MKAMAFLSVILLAVFLAGCGNVNLSGDALTSVQQSTLDSYTFWSRVDGNAQPFVKAYAQENVTQWRYFARAALRDQNWGPKLPGDSNQ
jgi:outer membrane PBP1 activator LpoA protein